jgi:hypothetical protein
MIKHLRANLVIQTFVLIALIAIAGFGTAAAQSAEPKTVADFFRLVPERYMIGYDLKFREQLLRGERRGTVVDITNGYISWNASDNPEEFEFAIFRKNNGKYIVAFSVGYDPDFDFSHFFLLSYDGGRWRDVTTASLPVPYNRTYTYKLPRKGRSIVVTGEGKLYKLTWANDRFRLKRREKFQNQLGD